MAMQRERGITRRVAVVHALEVALIVAALATIPLALADEQGVDSIVVAIGDWIVWAVFVAELVGMLYLAPDRRNHLLRNWLSIAVVVVAFPVWDRVLLDAGQTELNTALQIVRLTLVTGRLLGALRSVIGRRRVIYVAMATAVLVLAGGGGLAIIEPNNPSVEGGLTFWDGVWWAAVTATTVGYGDIYPRTLPGRLIGVSLMVAGIGLVSTLAATLAALFVEQDVNAEQREIERRLRQMGNHIIIGGLGRKGTLLASAFLERGYQVVAIERDESNVEIRDLREQGAIVLVGDATDPPMLQRAGVMTAEGLLAVCTDDDTNADIVIHANELVKARQGDPLQGLAHIVDPLLCDLFKRLEVGSTQTGGFRLQFFNVFDGAARALLQAYPAFEPAGADPARQVLVVGLGHIGQRLVFNLARNWRERYLASGEQLGITMVDRDADRVKDTLCTRYPQVEAACNLAAYPHEHRTAAFHQGRFLTEGAGARGFGVVYVSLENDAASLSAALEIRQKIHDLSVPVIACMDESTGLVRLLGGMDGSGNRVEGLFPFRVLDQTCTPAVLLDSTNEMLARAQHEDFVRHELAAGHTAATNPNVVPWDELPEAIRESGRQAVDHIPVKLRAVGCDIEPMVDWDADLFEFTPDEINSLAELEHERWRDERSRGGYTYGPVRDDVAHTHPDLLPWAQLSEESREKNRTFIRGLPAYLAGVGFQINRRDGTGDRRQATGDRQAEAGALV